MTNRQVVYTAPPVDADFQPEASFDVTETTITDRLGAGAVLVRNRLLSVDPYHRFFPAPTNAYAATSSTLQGALVLWVALAPPSHSLVHASGATESCMRPSS